MMSDCRHQTAGSRLDAPVPHQYRVTKYDPDLRDSLGSYRAEDWTSRSDIGESFGGTVLTEEHYLSVEQAYVEAATAFLQEAGVGRLRIVDVENHSVGATTPADQSLLELEQIRGVLRSLLREEYWCKLEAESAYIHVGYDYCMYVGVPAECLGAEVLARRLGLFTEIFPSPYRAEV